MGFQERVLKLLQKIPEGKVTTYKIIAKKLGTRAYRAVGNACNKNQFSPEIPCHMVVTSKGNIGGYAKGTKKKTILLRSEGLKISRNKILDFEKVLYRF